MTNVAVGDDITPDICPTTSDIFKLKNVFSDEFGGPIRIAIFSTVPQTNDNLTAFLKSTDPKKFNDIVGYFAVQTSIGYCSKQKKQLWFSGPDPRSGYAIGDLAAKISDPSKKAATTYLNDNIAKIIDNAKYVYFITGTNNGYINLNELWKNQKHRPIYYNLMGWNNSGIFNSNVKNLDITLGYDLTKQPTPDQNDVPSHNDDHPSHKSVDRKTINWKKIGMWTGIVVGIIIFIIIFILIMHYFM